MSARRVCIVTGSRAEWGLLRRVAVAVTKRHELELQIVAAGSHLLLPAETWRDIDLPIDSKVPMQQPGISGRLADAEALGRGVSGFASTLTALKPDWVVVLGDRIEAFAAAAAASVGGLAVAHIHGGDRAEGIADEAMRHAITKLAHLHLPATQQSMDRIIRMGEPSERVKCVGSPAIDALTETPSLDESRFRALGSPELVALLHPAGLPEDGERAYAEAMSEAMTGRRVLWLAPNHDAGRESIAELMVGAARAGVVCADHLPREQFVGLLKRLSREGGALIGNSSAGLIEAAALRCPVVDIGPRQAGRERPNNVVHVDEPDASTVRQAIEQATGMDRMAIRHPYGQGTAGDAIADLLATMDPHAPGFLRKRNAY